MYGFSQPKSEAPDKYKESSLNEKLLTGQWITKVILLREKFLQFDWLRAVVFQLNLKYLHVKITNLLRVVV